MGVSAFSQEKGKIALDATLNPASLFDAGAGPLFQMPAIKLRYFLAEDLAIRVGLMLDMDGGKSYPSNDKANSQKNSSMFFGIAPGIEKHFPMGKISPYVGAAISIGVMSSSEEQTIATPAPATTTTWKNTWQDGTHRGYMSFGVNAIVGADYYVLDNLYLGFEFGFGYNRIGYSDASVTTGAVTTNNFGYSSSNFSLSASSGLKIGVRF